MEGGSSLTPHPAHSLKQEKTPLFARRLFYFGSQNRVRLPLCQLIESGGFRTISPTKLEKRTVHLSARITSSDGYWLMFTRQLLPSY